ncbi:MAG TPA: hypothetical protein VGO00_06515 [Kofleriaceae bacterium]|nr:hypothetical protein [Kofleriaceae bacterium]
MADKRVRGEHASKPGHDAPPPDDEVRTRGVPKGARRAVRPVDGAYTLARKFTLAPITHGDPARGWMIEPAWDGHRVLATRDGDSVRLAAADYREWTQTFPSCARGLAKLPARSCAIDGVVCVMDARGAPSFDRLRSEVAAGKSVPSAVLIAWDLLWLDDEDLRALPLAERRRRLGALLADAAGVILSQALDGAIDDVVAAVAPLGIRGVVARVDGPYDSPWFAVSATDAPVDWRRSLSPPPPLSNADKVLYPRDAVCKRDIAAYYRDIAPAIVPHLLDRPVVVQRWPDGIDEFDWYQHRVPPRAPDYLRAAWVDGVRRMVIENGDALLWMANQAGLVYHGFASRLATLVQPDWAMIDLDPGERTTWADIVDVALAVRKLLELLELSSVVKTSGQRGIHVLVPLAPGHDFAQAEAFGDGIGSMLARLLPDKVTLEFDKEKRFGKLLVDTRQFMAKTLVVPYSLRGVDGAPVSTPIGWDEVTPSLDPRAFTLRTIRDRLDTRGDLAAGLLDGTGRLDRALAQLRAQG